MIYASVYREMPLAVVYPRDASDVKECIKFARNGITLIPRAAGTSLAGQVVGNGVVVEKVYESCWNMHIESAG